MKVRDLKKLGITGGEPMKQARALIGEMKRQKSNSARIQDMIRAVIHDPETYHDHPLYGSFAQLLPSHRFTPLGQSAPYQQWGEDLDVQSIQQMENACALPVAVAGALMPDAHVGYGLPIGGVLATDNAVIPYAVGVDIACRVKITVLDLPLKKLDAGKDKEQLTRAIAAETRFGVGSAFKDRRRHDVLDEDWSVSAVTQRRRTRRGASSAPAVAAIISWSSAR